MKKVLILVTLFICSFSFSQKSYEIKDKEAFQPMFSIGTGYYNSFGDIRGPEGNYLLGNMGINTGIRINLYNNVDLSFLFSSNAKLYEESEMDFFEADLTSLGFNLDYTFNNILGNTKISPFTTIGAQWMYYTTTFNNNTFSQESGVNIPLGMGISLDVSERIRFDIGMNYHISFADIDRATSIAQNDNFSVVNFTINYDLFSKKANEYNVYNEKNYRNINFKALDIEDEDKDGVPDVNDECPGTPKNVKVNEFGCPFDSDGDGVPNYMDDEKNTKAGAVVNEKGVQLTGKEFHSMYSEYESASRKYANFYNNLEINRDDYTTTNDILIAQANAFNQKFNLNNQKLENSGKRYLVQIGRYLDDIPRSLENRFLSFVDLVSIPLEDGSFIYAVGQYEIIDDAEDRRDYIEIKYGELETKIIVTDNDSIYDYIYKVQENINANVLDTSNNSITIEDSIKLNLNNSIEKVDSIEKTIENIIYRVQIGAFKQELSFDIFKGLNVIPIRTEGITRYYIGSFTEMQDALIKRSEMQARGFTDAFIATFENGKRVKINIIIEEENKSSEIENEEIAKFQKIVNESVESEELIFQEELMDTNSILQDTINNAFLVNEDTIPVNIEYFIQIGIFSSQSNDEETQYNIASIGGADTIITNGIFDKYVCGPFKTFDAAKNKNSEIQNFGFPNSFIYAKNNGVRIRVEKARDLMIK